MWVKAKSMELEGLFIIHRGFGYHSVILSSASSHLSGPSYYYILLPPSSRPLFPIHKLFGILFCRETKSIPEYFPTQPPPQP